MSVAEFHQHPPAEDYPSQLDRTPPSDHAAEQSVLGAMLLSKDAIADVVEVIRGVDFYRPAHETIYDAVVDLYGRGEPADAVTVSAELQRQGELGRVGGAPYLHTLVAGVPIAANAGYYAAIVREKAILRRLVDAGTRIAQMGYAEEGDVDDVVDRAQAEVYGVVERRSSEDYAPLSEIMEATLDEIEAIGNRGGEMVGVPTGFAELDELTNGLHPGQLVLIAARPAMGKALALATPLPTPTGWTTMGEVRVGDYLLGADGRPTKVVAATEVMHNRPCYEVGFSGGEAIVADAEHRWVTWDRNTRKAYDDANPGMRAYPSDWPSWSPARKAVTPRTTADIAATVRAGDEHNHAIPATQPLALPDADLPLDPYVLGYLLGDGDTAGSGRVACDAQDRKWLIEAFRDAGYVAREHSDDGHFGVLGIAQAWRSLGLDDGKHIPAAYLRASVTQRMALVQGLVDSDGHVDSHGAYGFTSTSRRLIDGFVELVASLGCVPQARHRRGRVRAGVVCADSWDVIVPTGFPLARLPRKAVHARTVWNREHCSRYVTAARSVESVPVRCVQVDSPDHLYLAGRSMIPTHNSTLALDVARAASIKHGLTTVMFSLEMTRNEITMRLLSAEGRIPLHHMRNGHMSDDDWQRLARKMGEVSSAPLFIDDSPNMTMTEIRAKARRLKQRNDLRMVVLDYIQLMTSGKKVESRQVEVSEFSRQLKLLAKELDVPVVALSQLNRGAEQRSDKRPMLSDLRESGCLTADTRLMRADNGGEISLGELVASQARNIAVWALDDRLKLVPRTLTHAFPSGVKEVLRLRFASGREIKATASHRFLTYGGWRALGDLVVGDRLGTIRHLPAPLQPAAMDDDEVVLSAQQLVAAPVFGAPNAQVGLFLRQLWAAGGSVDWPRGASCADVSCATSSRRLADQVASLLLRFDIYARVSRVPGREAYHVTIDGVEHQLRFLDQIGVHGVRGDAAREIAGRLRASRPAPELDTVPEAVWASVKAALERRPVAVGQSAPRRLDAVTSILDDGGLELQAANDVYWDTIAGIESIGAQEVYDATVLGLHNFVADGVAAHNSLEQDADVVILLHRDDAYEKESLRPGEADLIVAKHRNGPTKDVVVAFQGHYSRFVDMAHG